MAEATTRTPSGPRRRASRAALALLALCAASVFGSTAAVGSEIRIDGRPVETKADGPCLDALTVDAQLYVDCGNGTIYDTLNDLLWLRDASCNALGTLGYGDWQTAQNAVAGVANGLDCDGDQLPDLTDHSQPGDWRLPTRREWDSLLTWANISDCVAGGTGGAPAIADDTGAGCSSTLPSSFVGIQIVEYWSSEVDETDPSSAHTADLLFGELSTFARNVSFAAAIWPVRRGGSPDQAGRVVVDDAVVDVRAESSCSSGLSPLPERYRSCGDGTVYDAATRLLWLRDASCADLQNYGPLGADWAHARQQADLLEHGVCGLTDGSQKGDWRLPTMDEWFRTTEAADEIFCDVPPSLTDTSGTLCASEGPTPFIGLSDTEISETDAYAFWTASALPGQDRAAAFVLYCAISQCEGLHPWQLPLCVRCGAAGPAAKDTPGIFVWPVRELD